MGVVFRIAFWLCFHTMTNDATANIPLSDEAYTSYKILESEGLVVPLPQPRLTSSSNRLLPYPRQQTLNGFQFAWEIMRADSTIRIRKRDSMMDRDYLGEPVSGAGISALGWLKNRFWLELHLLNGSSKRQ